MNRSLKINLIVGFILVFVAGAMTGNFLRGPPCPPCLHRVSWPGHDGLAHEGTVALRAEANP